MWLVLSPEIWDKERKMPVQTVTHTSVVTPNNPTVSSAFADTTFATGTVGFETTAQADAGLKMLAQLNAAARDDKKLVASS
jgi:hypothetical protein